MPGAASALSVTPDSSLDTAKHLPRRSPVTENYSLRARARGHTGQRRPRVPGA